MSKKTSLKDRKIKIYFLMIGEKMSYTENILKMLPDRINQRNDLMVTPPWIAKDMINLLPEEVWNKNSTF